MSNPVGWGLLGAGVGLGGLSYYLSGKSVPDSMQDADESLDPVRDRRARERDDWEEYDELTGRDTGGDVPDSWDEYDSTLGR